MERGESSKNYYEVNDAFNTVINELKEEFMNCNVSEFADLRSKICGMEEIKEKVMEILFERTW